MRESCGEGGHSSTASDRREVPQTLHGVARGGRAGHGRKLVNQAIAIAPLALGAILLSACADDHGARVELCAGILERRLPASEVVEIARHPSDGPEITYDAVDEDGAPVRGRLECKLERSRSGGLRVRSVTLDGRPLSEAEIVVLNANLLLDDLDRTGRRLHDRSGKRNG
jgi:hypothetical protein